MSTVEQTRACSREVLHQAAILGLVRLNWRELTVCAVAFRLKVMGTLSPSVIKNCWYACHAPRWRGDPVLAILTGYIAVEQIKD
jgi:hypothetical protein